MKALSLYFICLIILLEPMHSQTLHMIGDINPGGGSSLFDEYNVVIEFDGKLLFTADDGTHGNEVWIYDGLDAMLLKDIKPGPGSSNAQNYFIVNGQVLFTAQDNDHGMEWWKTDGTEDGTILVKDIFPGSTSGVFTGINNRKYFFLYNGEVYFTAAHRLNDYELWKSDGTSTGTILVKNIAPDGFGNFSSFPEDFAEFQGNLYFGTSMGLWKTNGTSMGTVLVEDTDPEDPFGLDPEDLISNGEYLLFIQNTDLWRSDGTSAGTMKIKDLDNVNLNWPGNRFALLGNTVLFPAADQTHGEELWKSDGTTEGTTLVVDLDPGSDGYAPQNAVVFNNKIYYKGNDGNTGIEFWSSDGTNSGTQLIKDIVPGSSSGFYLPTEIFTDGEQIFMNAGNLFDKELWISDGTSTGTYEFDINPDGESRPGKFYKYGDKLFLFANSDEFGFEPYLLNFTETSVYEESNYESIAVYPNPTNEHLYLKTHFSDIFHSIYNLDGNLIIGTSRSEVIDVSGFPAGIYILKFHNTPGYLQSMIIIVSE